MLARALSADFSVVLPFHDSMQPELVHGYERTAYARGDGGDRDRALARARELVTLHAVHIRERRYDPGKGIKQSWPECRAAASVK